MNTSHATAEPPRSEVDSWDGATVLEFGTDWCGHCRAAQPLISGALADHGNVRHVKVDDGPGRPLGRSFQVKLWPTLVFIKDGREVARVVRPRDTAEVRHALERIDS